MADILAKDNPTLIHCDLITSIGPQNYGYTHLTKENKGDSHRFDCFGNTHPCPGLGPHTRGGPGADCTDGRGSDRVRVDYQNRSVGSAVTLDRLYGPFGSAHDCSLVELQQERLQPRMPNELPSAAGAFTLHHLPARKGSRPATLLGRCIFNAMDTVIRNI